MKDGSFGSQPHQGQPVLAAGEPLEDAHAAMLMIHGRVATPEDILSLAGEFGAAGFAYLAPQASGSSWYPNRFLVPLETNEPWLSSALSVVGDVFNQIIAAGLPSERIMLLGFLFHHRLFCTSSPGGLKGIAFAPRGQGGGFLQGLGS